MKLPQVFLKYLLSWLFFILPCAQKTSSQNPAQSVGLVGWPPAAGACRARGTAPMLQPALVTRKAEDRALDSFIYARKECFNTGCPGRLTAFLMYAKKKKKKGKTKKREKSLDREQSSATSLFVPSEMQAFFRTGSLSCSL